ncbi:sarcosine oxidase subunit delta [Phaeovulum sp.]|uniref:sarcosine oxidase subunit delta n=1 Tax=Phaeovulum sp. TaxID=2934796 RepID=UPI0035656705
MRLICPNCGPRDRREFSWIGAASLLDRPAPGGDFVAWLHLRDNPAGPLEELWLHEAGCGALLRASRDTRTHALAPLTLAGGAR